MWTSESYCVRQLHDQSGLGVSKIKRIKNHWLNKQPNEVIDLSQYKYILYDGTYFHKNGCFICLMDAITQRTISNIYASHESYKSVYPWLRELKAKGLDPLYIALDGEKSVIRAVHQLWPATRIQRCLYHIQHEGMRWLRSNPNTIAGRELRILLGTLCAIRDDYAKEYFIKRFQAWCTRHKEFINTLTSHSVVFKDLKKTRTLITNALPNMFHYLVEGRIPSTTNLIESVF